MKSHNKLPNWQDILIKNNLIKFILTLKKGQKVINRLPIN